MLLSMVLAVAAAASPAPPPEIVHTKVSAFCTALREQIGPALYGLSLNNKILSQGDSAMVRLGHDYTMSTGVSLDSAMALDTAKLRELAERLAHNNAVIDAFLAQATPKQPTPDDERLAAIKKSLERVKAAQSIAINILSGTAETQALDDFMNAGNDMMSAGLGPQLSNSVAVKPFGAGPLSDMARPQSKITHAVHGDQFALGSPVGSLYKSLLLDQQLVNDAATQAASLVIESAQHCH